jgi:hypothetical protein
MDEEGGKKNLKAGNMVLTPKYRHPRYEHESRHTKNNRINDSKRCIQRPSHYNDHFTNMLV